MSKHVFSRLCINHRNATPVEGCRVAPLSSEVCWHQDVTQIDPLSSQAASIACLTLVPCCAVRCRTALLAVGPRTRATAEGSTRGIFQQTWANQGPWATGSLQNTMPNITSGHAHLHHFRTLTHLFLLLGVLMLAHIRPYLNFWLGWGGMVTYSYTRREDGVGWDGVEQLL